MFKSSSTFAVLTKIQWSLRPRNFLLDSSIPYIIIRSDQRGIIRAIWSQSDHTGYMYGLWTCSNDADEEKFILEKITSNVYTRK